MEAIKFFTIVIVWPLFVLFFSLFSIVFTTMNLVYALNFWNAPQLPIIQFAWHFMLLFNIGSTFVLSLFSFLFMIGGTKFFRILFFGRELGRF